MNRRPSKVVPFRASPCRHGKPPRPRGWIAALVALPLAAFSAVLLFDGPPRAGATVQSAAGEQPATRFGLCAGAGALGGNCVVDGDTFWFEGEKIRVADINTPETGEPGCVREAELGAAATTRFQALLNEGGFALETVDRDRDQYGRLLRVVTRDGESLGATLVAEGLAEEWRGRRGSWC
jgi:micrococcal nuclease